VANIVCSGVTPYYIPWKGLAMKRAILKRNARPLFERANYKAQPPFNPVKKKMMVLIFKVF
jgi:hypothetical protein